MELYTKHQGVEVEEERDRRRFLIWWASRNHTPKDRNAVAGTAIAGIAIAGRNQIEGE